LCSTIVIVLFPEIGNTRGTDFSGLSSDVFFFETEGSVGHPSDNQIYRCRAQEKGLARKKDWIPWYIGKVIDIGKSEEKRVSGAAI